MSKRKTETIEEMMSYRTPMQVREVFVCHNNALTPHLCAYPICPKCDIFFERDYQAYCGHCGQKLKWTRYDKAKLRYADE